MQVADSGLSHMGGISVAKHILRNDGIPGLFRGFGTSATGALPGRVLSLTALEMSKDMMFKYTEALDMPEATRVGIANGVAGMLSNLVSCVYYVPLDVVCKFFSSFYSFPRFFCLQALTTQLERKKIC
jgi:solute carrier family 25 protein 44